MIVSTGMRRDSGPALLLMGCVVLLVADLLQPVHDLAIELFLDGDMGHGGSKHGAMPMLFARRAPDNVAPLKNLDRTAPALHQAAPRRHEQRLTQRVGMPFAPGAPLQCDGGAAQPCPTGAHEQLG